MDWYRLKQVEGEDAGLAEECFSLGAVTLVEWAERGRSVLPAQRVEIKMSHRGPKSRLIEIGVVGKKFADLLELLS